MSQDTHTAPVPSDPIHGKNAASAETASAAPSGLNRSGLRFYVLLAAALFSVGTFALSWWHWWTFEYRSFDLAFYVQALWLAVRGQWHVSLLDVSLMGNHAEPIVFLLLPVFALLPHPMTLVAVQILAIASAPFTAWRIARRLEISEGGALALSLLTLAAPATGFVAIHEFHPEALSIPCLLLLIDARLAGSHRRFWLWFLMSMACKENITLMLIGWSAVHAWCDRGRDLRWQWRWNIAPLLAAAAWFSLYAFWLSPVLNGGRVDYGNLYAHLGGSAREALVYFFTEPHRFWGALWRGVSGGNLVWGLAVTFAALPLFRPRWLLITLPLFLQHLLSFRYVEWNMYLHYSAPLIPALWMATAETASRYRAHRFLPYLPLAASAILHFWVSPLRIAADDYATLDRGFWNHEWKSALIQKITAEPKASVSATMDYLSHIAARENLYSIHLVFKGLQTLSAKPYEPPYDPDIVLIDYADREIFNTNAGLYHPEGEIKGVPLLSSDRLLNQFLSKYEWRSESVNSVTLLHRGERIQEEQPAAQAPAEILPGSSLLGAALTPGSDGAAFTLELTWNLSQPRNRIPWLTVLLSHGETGYLVPVGLCAPEIREGHAVERRKILLPPHFPAGAYKVGLDFSDQLAVLWKQTAAAPVHHAVSVGSFVWNGEAGQIPPR